MNKINLEEILKKQIDCNYPSFTFLEGDSIPWEDVIKSMKEACRQTLELAAENAKAFDTIHSWNTPSIDAQSILNTIKQIE